MTQMRIVGLNSNKVFVQKMVRKNAQWDQTAISYKEFTEMMKNEYPGYFKEYEQSGATVSAAEWFYNYGETEDMRRKGESFIYR